LLSANDNASARVAGCPGGPPPEGALTGSPLASCNKTLGFSNCDLSVFLRFPSPEPRILAKRASRDGSKNGAGADEAPPISGIGGGGGGGPPAIEGGKGGGGGGPPAWFKDGIGGGGGGGAPWFIDGIGGGGGGGTSWFTDGIGGGGGGGPLCAIGGCGGG
jgi:hypothetical protein